jgi:hypothetical protein
MKTLVFQLFLKQWDKSQRSPEHQAVITKQSEAYPIASQPEFMLFDTPCVLDQHALDFTTQPLEPITAEHLSGKNAGRVIHKTLLNDGRAKLDRFIISNQNEQFLLFYEDEEGVITDIGPLNNGWLQAKYQWRYRIEKNQEIFWQYEEVTLNAALVEHYAEGFFLTDNPAQTFYKDLK